MILVTTAGKVGAEVARLIALHLLTFDEEKEGMIRAGLPDSLAAMNARAVALFAEGDSDYATDDMPSLLGRPTGAHLGAVRHRLRRGVLVKPGHGRERPFALGCSARRHGRPGRDRIHYQPAPLAQELLCLPRSRTPAGQLICSRS